jgi:hypothetical protein
MCFCGVKVFLKERCLSFLVISIDIQDVKLLRASSPGQGYQ